MLDRKTIPKPGISRPQGAGKPAAFQDRFGEFKSRHVAGLHFGPAPTGEWVRHLWTWSHGFDLKVAIPFHWLPAVRERVALAMMTAAARSSRWHGPAAGSSMTVWLAFTLSAASVLALLGRLTHVSRQKWTMRNKPGRLAALTTGQRFQKSR